MRCNTMLAFALCRALLPRPNLPDPPDQMARMGTSPPVVVGWLGTGETAAGCGGAAGSPHAASLATAAACAAADEQLWAVSAAPE